MNDQELREILLKLAAPAPEGAEKARHRAEIAFANRSAAEVASRPATQWLWRLLGFACLAAVLVCVGLPHWKLSSGADRSERKLLAEMEALFPGQVDGVITSGDEVSLALAPEQAPPNKRPSQPLALTLQRGRQIVRVLGYSGRKICVNFGGRKRCLEPLVTAAGKVIVEGDDFLWSDAQPMLVSGYRVEARTL